MGVGKSTIGLAVSKTLNMNFVDVDVEIEKKEFSSIKSIFDNKGEKYFREIEEKISMSFLNNEESVIALGGGAFINAKIRNKILESAVSVWLDLKIDLLLRRLKDSKKRPLLDNNNLRKVLNNIYDERKKTYNLANYKIKCDQVEKSQIVKKIVEIYETNTNNSQK